MQDPAITEFFHDRKAAWLKKSIKASMSETEVRDKELECDDIFALEQWLPNAAKRAGQISISTHPCTFSHPSARKNKNGYASSIIATAERANDGYLRSGNVVVEADALGNAAALDVYKFLMLKMADGETLLHHIEHDTDLAQALLSVATETYPVLQSGFLAMVRGDADCVTSAKIKQVYFPVEGGYHQLSLLTASGMVFELRKRIDTMRFSEAAKDARNCEKNNTLYDGGYRQLVDITTIGYGGTKPQNISVLNNQNGGKAHLLSSKPPNLAHRDIQFPTSDFFTQTLSFYRIKDLLQSLQAIFLHHKNDWQVRSERDDYYLAIFDRIVERMWSVRAVAQEQFNPDTTRLNKNQKIWLCAAYEQQRGDEDDWLDSLADMITRYIFEGYKKTFGKNAIMFSDSEFSYLYKLILDNKEALR